MRLVTTRGLDRTYILGKQKNTEKCFFSTKLMCGLAFWV